MAKEAIDQLEAARVKAVRNPCTLQVTSFPAANTTSSEGVSLGTIHVDKKYAKKEAIISLMLRLTRIRKLIGRRFDFFLDFMNISLRMHVDPMIDTAPLTFGTIARAFNAS